MSNSKWTRRQVVELTNKFVAVYQQVNGRYPTEAELDKFILTRVKFPAIERNAVWEVLSWDVTQVGTLLGTIGHSLMKSERGVKKVTELLLCLPIN